MFLETDRLRCVGCARAWRKRRGAFQSGTGTQARSFRRSSRRPPRLVCFPTFLGGAPARNDRASFATQEDDGPAPATGENTSRRPPVTPHRCRPTCHGGIDAAKARLALDCSDTIFSSFLGGGGEKRGSDPARSRDRRSRSIPPPSVTRPPGRRPLAWSEGEFSGNGVGPWRKNICAGRRRDPPQVQAVPAPATRCRFRVKGRWNGEPGRRRRF